MSDTRSHSQPRNRHYSNDRSRNSSYKVIETIPTLGTEVIQIIEISKDPITTIIKIDHEITSKIGIQPITIDKETTLNHLIEITHVIQILKANIEVIHQNIRDK